MKTQDCTDTTYQAYAASLPDRVAKNLWESPTRVLLSVFRALVVWQRRVNSRRQLAEMETRLLVDMGLTRDDADREAGKSFWRA